MSADVAGQFDKGMVITSGPVVVATCCVPLHEPLVQCVEAVIDARWAQGEQSVFFAIRLSTGQHQSPPEGLRARYAQMISERAEAYAGLGVVFERDGLLASARASILAGILALAKTPCPSRIFGDLDELEDWVSSSPFAMANVMEHFSGARQLILSDSYPSEFRPQSLAPRRGAVS